LFFYKKTNLATACLMLKPYSTQLKTKYYTNLNFLFLFLAKRKL